MNNIRYDKLNALIYLQNQKSHYRRILEAKKNINFKDMDNRSNSHHSHQHTIDRVQKNRERERKENNIKLVKKINEINSRNGLLQNMSIQAKKKQQEKQKKDRVRSLKTQNYFYSNQQSAEDIEKFNLKFIEKLKDVKPSIGNQKQWKSHFKIFKDNEKKLRKYSLNKTYDPQLQLRQTISHFQDGVSADRVTFDRLDKISRNNFIEEQTSRPVSKDGRKIVTDSGRLKKKNRRGHKSQKANNTGKNQVLLQFQKHKSIKSIKSFNPPFQLQSQNRKSQTKTHSQKLQARQKFKAEVNELVGRDQQVSPQRQPEVKK